MSNKRPLSNIAPDKGTSVTPSKRVGKPQGCAVLDFNKPDVQSSGGANQDTPRKVAKALLSLSEARSPLERSSVSWISMEFDPAQDSANPFWSPEQSSQPGPETPIRLRSAFIPNTSIDSPEQSSGSPTPYILSETQALTSHARNVLSPGRVEPSSDDSDISPNTSPKKPTFTPKKTVSTPARINSSSDDSASSSDDADISPDTSPTKHAFTPTHSDATPTQPILSPMQFLSSPSQAVLERPIPLPDKENEESDDVGPQLFSRSKAIGLCQEVFNCTPKEQQLEVLEYIAQKIDCVLIAPCGWGKTLAFFLPMAYWPSSITAIISPLIALMNDQQQKLVNAKIPHIVLSGDNSDAIDSDTIRRICDGEFRAVFMSPEIIFGNSPTSRLVQGLWHNKCWRGLLLAIVVDEVHCIEKWGGKFRPEYARLGELRIWSPGVPFVGVTATLTADALTQTMEKLFLPKATVLRVREIPTNVRLEVHTQPMDAKNGLNRLLDKDKTIVYFEKISILMDVFGYLSTTRPDLQGKLGVYFSTCTPRKKVETMDKFVKGNIHVLLATEAAGMGCDIPDVIQVIQYGFPRDMPSLVQRIGRAARDPKIKGLGVLYAPPMNKTAPTDKNVREYIKNQVAGRCLWTLIDKLFGNDPRTCNNSCSGCFRADRPVPTTVRLNTGSSERRRYPSRSEEEKHMAFETLLAWRKETYERWVSRRPYRIGRETWMLPDNVAKQLSQRFSGARTAEAVKAIVSSCKWMPLLGDTMFGEIAQVLDKLNNEIDARRESGSQTTAASVLNQLKDGFIGGHTFDVQQLLGDQPHPAD